MPCLVQMAALDISVVLQKRELLTLPRRLSCMFIYSIADNINFTNFGPKFIGHHWNKVCSVVMADVKGVTMWVNFLFFSGAVERKLWTQYWNHHVVSHESCLCLLEECLIFSLLALVWSGSGFSTEKNIWLVQLISLSVLLQTKACTVGCRSLFTGNGCLLRTKTTPWKQTNCEPEMTVEFHTAE